MTITSFQFLIYAVLGAAVFTITQARWWRESIWLILNFSLIASLTTNLWSLLPFAVFLVIGYLSLRIVVASQSPEAPHQRMASGSWVRSRWLWQQSSWCWSSSFG